MKIKPRHEPKPEKITEAFYRYHVLDAELPAGMKIVLLAVAQYLPRPRPGLTRLCQETGLTRNTVRKYLCQAEEDDWLVMHKKGGPGRTNSDEYRVSLPGYAEYYSEQ